jgi:hypothetical protein
MATAVSASPSRASAPQLQIVNHKRADTRSENFLITAIVFSCVFQVLWFWSKCIHQIDIDGIDYVGIALKLRHGLFFSSVNGFRSPLISWIIALIPLDVFRAGKLVSVTTYPVCVGLTYVLASRLWKSKVVAGTAALIFSLSRGVAFDAVAMITPDLLLTTIVLVYFLVLLKCVRHDRRWLLLGVIHAIAFLAKAFALPWLTVISLSAVMLSAGSYKRRAQRFSLVILFPLLAAAFWASALHAKYGVFTTGTQFKTNLLQWTLKAYGEPQPPRYTVLRGITQGTDEYMVGDPMPPRSWPWSYRLKLRQVAPSVLKAESKNLPAMVKEFVILSNPGLLLGFSILVATLIRRRQELERFETVIAIIIVVGALALLFAYSMLVVDSRYLVPLLPLVIAFGARFLVPDPSLKSSFFRPLCWALVGGGIIIFAAYRSSPFRVQTRDFQTICYRAGAILARMDEPVETVVSIGSGPFPEHGVGWEAGYKATYFAGKRLIATDEATPSEKELPALVTDLAKAAPDAVFVWQSDDSRRRRLLSMLETNYSNKGRILDPALGDVGVVLIRAK